MEIGAAAFWICLAAVGIAIIWRNKHRESMRHETARLLIEKNQKLDEAQLAELLRPTPPPSPEWLWGPKPKPGAAYRMLRVFGTILVFVALGLVIVGFWRGLMLGIHDESVLEIGTAVAIVAMLGAGLFVASRFVVTLPSVENKGKQDL
jgi:hypothetical protein